MLNNFLLSLVLAVVLFTGAMLVTDVPVRASTVSKGYITGDISEFCVHARVEANDRLSEGLHPSYGPELAKPCGAL